MGWRTVVDVRDHSKARGSTYTVALMLAERAPDETRIARPGLKCLAHDARCDRSTAQRAIKWLVEHGEIEIVAYETGGRGRATEFKIVVGTEGWQDGTLSETAASDTKGPDPAPKGPQDATPTEVEPNGTEEHSGRAREAPIIDEVTASTWRPVLDPLNDVAIARNVGLEAHQIIAACERKADRAHAVEAQRFRDWYMPGGQGENVDVKSLAGRWRTWLGRAPRAETYRRNGRSPTGRRRPDEPTADELRAMAAEARARGQ